MNANRITALQAHANRRRRERQAARADRAERAERTANALKLAATAVLFAALVWAIIIIGTH